MKFDNLNFSPGYSMHKYKAKGVDFSVVQTVYFRSKTVCNILIYMFDIYEIDNFCFKSCLSRLNIILIYYNYKFLATCLFHVSRDGISIFYIWKKLLAFF